MIQLQLSALQLCVVVLCETGLASDIHLCMSTYIYYIQVIILHAYTCMCTHDIYISTHTQAHSYMCSYITMCLCMHAYMPRVHMCMLVISLPITTYYKVLAMQLALRAVRTIRVSLTGAMCIQLYNYVYITIKMWANILHICIY